ncbi:TIGR03086 family metal-binding protein [Oryzihumus sp.]
MSLPTDPLSLLARSLDQAGAVVAGVRDDQAHLPTPCRSWDVTALVEHLVHDLRQFTGRARGDDPDWQAPSESVDGEWVDAFRAGESALLEAWRAAGDLDGTFATPRGEVPKRFAVSQQTAEFACHAWDLAVATGQSTHLDEEVGLASLTWASTALQPEFRGPESEGKAFGPVVELPEDAPLYDRLAGFFGHHR